MIDKKVQIAGKRVKIYRERKGLSIEQLSRSLNNEVLVRDIKKFEEGKLDIPAADLFLICEAMNVPINLLFLENDKEFTAFLKFEGYL